MNEDAFRAILHFAVQQARLITNDQEALEVKGLYKEWEVQIGRELTVGEYVQYSGQLFRVLQTHIAQSEWKPGIGTESLYVVIDKEHEGTIDDPIPAKINMEYFNGKYYIEDEVLYLCIRDSGIALQFMPSQLVGNYFEIVNNEEVEIEKGTLENPIVVLDYSVGMNYEINKYYSIKGTVYLCIKEGFLYTDPSTLIGDYFEDITDKGTENEGTENEGTENEGTENEGTENEGTENEGTENEGEIGEENGNIENDDKDNNENEIIEEEGTLENPIIVEDYSVGINYEINKYYSINEEIYLCIRDGLLYHDPSTLIGNYFEKIN